MAKTKIKVRIATAKSIHGTAWMVPRDPATGKYLLCKRAPGTNNEGQWGFPGGGVDEGEHHDVAAAREGYEEIGVHVSVDDLHLTAHSEDTMVLWFEVFKRIKPKVSAEVSAFRWVSPIDFDEYKLHKSVKDYFKALRRMAA